MVGRQSIGKDCLRTTIGIREHIERVVPGFETTTSVCDGLAVSICPALRASEFSKHQAAAHVLLFMSCRVMSLRPDQFLMMTIRSHDQFNTSIYGLDDRYRGIYNGRRVVFLNR